MTGWKGVNDLIAKTAWDRDFHFGSVDDVWCWRACIHQGSPNINAAIVPARRDDVCIIDEGLGALEWMERHQNQPWKGWWGAAASWLSSLLDVQINIMTRVLPYWKIADSHNHPEGICDVITVSDFYNYQEGEYHSCLGLMYAWTRGRRLSLMSPHHLARTRAFFCRMRGLSQISRFVGTCFFRYISMVNTPYPYHTRGSIGCQQLCQLATSR